MKLPAILTVIALLSTVGFSSPGFAALTSEQRLADFTQLVRTIERNYGPLRLKKKTAKLDFKKEVETFKAKVAAAKNDSEFYQLLGSFLALFKDGHVSSSVPSNFVSRLGFTTDLIEGRVLIDTIDRTKIPESMFPFQRGDQLVSIDGVPVEQMIAELETHSNTGNPQSSQRIAAARLVERKESLALAVPKGVAVLGVLKKGAPAAALVSLNWITSGTPMIELDDLSGFADGPDNFFNDASSSDPLNDWKKLSLFNIGLPRASLEDFGNIGLSDIGNVKSMFRLPEGATTIGGMPVTAAIYEAAGKKIGILRIPSYSDKNVAAMLVQAVAVMQQRTDVLVIDQTNNPGGSIEMVSNISSLFANKTFTDVNFQIRPSLKWIQIFDGINDQLAQLFSGDESESAKTIKARFQSFSDEMRAAIAEKRFLTKPISLNIGGAAVGTIQPNRTANYTKPILILINELDFSGGDAFPAIMKDNGRATLFGAKTTGAGGNVTEFGPLANSFFKFTLTESLMVRPNGAYIENQGIVPDVAYEITEDDFLNGYRGYVKAFTVEALKLAGASAADLEAFKAK